MPYIIGTAGHIDHGKTSLIKALTGTDTDRLKEEKERGISIDLGFAHLDLPDGTSAGIVDVPGHERFIKNMLAGAHGIDLVLFTVAADDGVMPQTEEHLDIVHLLGVKMAIFVITKADLVSPARIAEVEEEIDILTLGTVLENSPKIAVSSVTGQGIAELKEPHRRNSKKPDQGRAERLLPPAGGPRLCLARAWRRRHRHGARAVRSKSASKCAACRAITFFACAACKSTANPSTRAGWGQRVAMNLTGPDRADDRPRPRDLPRENVADDRPLRRFSGSPAGGAQRASKIISACAFISAPRNGSAKSSFSAAAEKIEPKQSAYCQITLDEPLLALRGDHFIVRDETARRTLAGGMVINPWAKRHKRGDRELAGPVGSAALQGDVGGAHSKHLSRAAQLSPRRSTSIHQFLNVQGGTDARCHRAR